MNESTVKLLEQLANKLGTTSEYLWNVLLKQAPISATIDLMYFVIMSFAMFGLYKLHIRFMKEPEGGGYNAYDNSDATGFIMIFLLIALSILFIATFCSLGNVLNGYFNPEYWALKEIIGNVK